MVGAQARLLCDPPRPTIHPLGGRVLVEIVSLAISSHVAGKLSAEYVKELAVRCRVVEQATPTRVDAILRPGQIVYVPYAACLFLAENKAIVQTSDIVAFEEEPPP